MAKGQIVESIKKEIYTIDREIDSLNGQILELKQERAAYARTIGYLTGQQVVEVAGDAFKREGKEARPLKPGSKAEKVLQIIHDNAPISSGKVTEIFFGEKVHSDDNRYKGVACIPSQLAVKGFVEMTRDGYVYVKGLNGSHPVEQPVAQEEAQPASVETA